MTTSRMLKATCATTKALRRRSGDRTAPAHRLSAPRRRRSARRGAPAPGPTARRRRATVTSENSATRPSSGTDRLHRHRERRQQRQRAAASSARASTNAGDAAQREQQRPISVSSCRTSLRRPAPMAVRTAISRRRVVARASSTPATLAQAMISTIETSAISRVEKPGDEDAQAVRNRRRRSRRSRRRRTSSCLGAPGGDSGSRRQLATQRGADGAELRGRLGAGHAGLQPARRASARASSAGQLQARRPPATAPPIIDDRQPDVGRRDVEPLKPSRATPIDGQRMPLRRTVRADDARIAARNAASRSDGSSTTNGLDACRLAVAGDRTAGRPRPARRGPGSSWP